MSDPTESYIEMMKVWRETAKSLEQLATAALVLPTFFLRDILGIDNGEPLRAALTTPLVAAWAFFLLSILVGTLYQITVARLIGDAYSKTTTRKLYPNYQFWIVAVSLVLGLSCFVYAFATAYQVP